MSIIQKILNGVGIELKAAADSGTSLSSFSFERFSLARRGSTSITESNLTEAYRQHELVYACVNKIADVMNDAEIIVEESKSSEWQRVEAHPLVALFKRPNMHETGRDFRRLMVQSEQTAGIFYAEIVRSKAGLIVELHPLNPNRVVPKLNGTNNGIGYYEYTKSDGKQYRIAPEDMLIRRRADLTNRFFGLSPLAVALKSINSDLGLTDYIDAFFESDGTPSGILKVLNRSLNQTEADALQAGWRMKFGRGGSNQKGVAVLDKDVEFQKIGSNLNELASDSVGDRNESRICAAFGVAPNLVGALVGLRHATNNATAKAALRDFWDNKISPELAVFREWLTWFVLPEFEGIEAVQSGKVRVSFDISQAAFLQEDVNEIHIRARANLSAGGWTLNEFREATGKLPDAEGNYYLQPFNVAAVSPENRAIESVQKVEAGVDPTAAAPKQLSAQLEKKTIEFDGLTLGREPQGVELLINLKTLVADFDTEKEKATKVLTAFRNELIEQAVTEIEKLNESEIYRLTLSPTPKTRKQIEKVLSSAYIRGKVQVAAELTAQKHAKNITDFITEKKDLDDDDSDIVRFSDSVIAKIINEITARAINGYVSLTLLKLQVEEIISRLRDLLDGETIKYIEMTAGIAVNSSIQSGRRDEMEIRANEIKFYQYSAILDRNTCESCDSADGMEADTPDDLPDAPNPDCSGMGNCRCFIVATVV